MIYCTFIFLDAVLGGLGLYEPLVKSTGAGTTAPISSLGNSLLKGAMREANQNGIIGILTGIFEVTSAGISATIIFAFIVSLIFRSKY